MKTDHSRIPGTSAAVALLTVAAIGMVGLIIGGLYSLSRLWSWAFQLP